MRRHPESASRRHLLTAGLLGFILAFAGTSALSPPVAAQVHPPAEGVELPDAYLRMVERDPRAFQFRRAWFRETNRVKRNREILERRQAEGLGSENLEELSAPGQLETAVSGTRRVPVLLGKFSNTGADPITRASLQQELFTGPWPTGTMTDFYHEISYNNLTLTGTVYDWVQAPQVDTYYEGSSGCNGLDPACGARTGEYLKSVLDLNDASIDFSQYDNDGPDGVANSGDDDGFVDFVAFVQPEKGGECGTTNIWSHRYVYEAWWGAPYTTNDARNGGGFIKVSDYTIQPALGCGGGMIEIGVFCHEFGHAFGLPDLYDTDGTSNGLGTWCLMAAGSYGGDSLHPQTPTHMSAWCKEQLGWVTPTVVCSDQVLQNLPQVETTPFVLKIYPHGVPDTEYFLVENRRQTGFDTWIRTSGLAVWHVDNDQLGNANENHKLVDLEEADGLNGLDLKTNRGDAGDLFPGSSVKRDFDDTTNPNARDYQGANTGFALHNISDAGNPMTASVSVDDCRIMVWDYVVIDSSQCGSGNHLLDAGETAWLAVTAWNIGSSHSGVTGTLSSTTPGVTINAGVVSFGNLASGQKQAGLSNYKVTLAPGTPAGTVINFQVAISADAGAYLVNDTFTLTTGRTVLLVDDDAGASRESWYTGPITAAAYPLRAWNLQTQGPLRPGLLKTSGAVVWLTAQAYDNTLTPTDQEIITDYLATGGRLFLTGQDIGFDLDDSGTFADRTFYHNTLKASFVLDDTNDNTMTGVAGDPIGDGLSFSINGGDGASDNDYPSQIATFGGSSPIFVYNAGVIGGIRYAGTGRLVYAAFCFEGISTQPDRNLVMSRILTWLLPAESSCPPTALVLSPNGGEVFAAGSLHPITYQVSDAGGVDSTCLEYSLDNGAAWLPIACTTNDSLYTWMVPAVASDVCRVRITAWDGDGNSSTDSSDGPFRILPASGVPGQVAGLQRATLFQNRPNPFNPATTLAYYLPGPDRGELSIYDLQGRKVRILVSGPLPAGYHEFAWDGRDDSGRTASSGIFFAVFEAGPTRVVRKMVLMK